ncbi:hypothetical protein M433DRAFT_235517 [Acidomyces richmondensis BFW]|nr:MAG: hypothetical protein FE78DRAFT_379840 [Acidomyces sp. 'richmondensis']KYG45846.1 hypothetical protein M433DRAFT_235517 [Acidomyces richmondensis BFW]
MSSLPILKRGDQHKCWGSPFYEFFQKQFPNFNMQMSGWKDYSPPPAFPPMTPIKLECNPVGTSTTTVTPTTPRHDEYNIFFNPCSSTKPTWWNFGVMTTTPARQADLPITSMSEPIATA